MSPLDTEWSPAVAVEQSVQSGVGRVGSLLLTLIARLQRTTVAGETQGSDPSAAIERSMSRKPADEVNSLPSSAKGRSRFSRRHGATQRTDEMPQPILPNSIPQVHDRLPDPARWSKIQEKFDRMEARTESEPVFAKESSKTNTPSSSDDNSDERLTVKETSADKATTAPKTRNTLPSSKSKTTLLKRSKRGAPDSLQLEGALRRRQMYCSTGFHIQILKNGRVSGTRQDHDQHAILEFISIDVGLVSIRGVVSGKYLAMDSKGRLYGSNRITNEAIFREHLQENWYNTYSSLRHVNKSNSRPCLVSYGRKSRSRHGCRTNENHRFTHFLPRPVDPTKVPLLYKGILY